MKKFGFGGQGLSGNNDTARELTRAKWRSKHFHSKRKRKPPAESLLVYAPPTTTLIKAKTS